MNAPIRLVALAALLSAFSIKAAETTVKLAVVDLAQLFNTHYKTAEHEAKLQSDEQKAQEQINRLLKEGNALAEEYKQLVEQASNPTLNAEAKAKAQTEAQRKLELIQGKQRELQTFTNEVRSSLAQSAQTFRAVLLDELTKISSTVARRRGANVLLDKSGPSGLGVSNLLFADAAFDITDDVLKEIGKDRSSPSATAAGPGPAVPAITVPGLQPKN